MKNQLRASAVLLACLVSLASTLEGQTGTSPGVITASGNGMVELPADFAALVLGVQIRASSPDTASARMSRRLDSVIDTLTALGIPRDSLPTSRFDLRPRVSTAEGRRVTEYEAESLVRLRVWDLEGVSEILSAAIAGGATSVVGLDYRSTREREGRDEALRLATEEANRDARVMAEAQGRELSRLVSATSTRSSVGFDRNLVMMGRAVVAASRFESSITPAQIVPIGVSISVQVTVEWEVR
jgi:uncharacterized protein YggE